MVREFHPDRVLAAQGHAGLEHEIAHLVALVHEAVTAGMRGDDAGEGVTGFAAATGFQRCLASIEGAEPGRHQHAVIGGFGLVVDHPTDGGWPVAQGCGALQHFNALDALDARIEVALIADEQAGGHGYTILQDQGLGFTGREPAQADIGDNSGFFLTGRVDTRHPAQGVICRQWLQQFQPLTVDQHHRARLARYRVIVPADHLDHWQRNRTLALAVSGGGQ